MSIGTDAIKVANPKVGGGVFRAPLGTPIPTSYEDELDPAFEALGYVGEEGVSKTEDNESDDKIAWGGDAVADLPGTHAVSYNGTFLESRNATLLKALRGAENVIVGPNGAITVKGNAKRPPRAVYVIDTDSVREVIPNGQIRTSGDTVFVHNDTISYPATWKGYPDANGDKFFTHFPGDDDTAPPTEG